MNKALISGVSTKELTIIHAAIGSPAHEIVVKFSKDFLYRRVPCLDRLLRAGTLFKLKRKDLPRLKGNLETLEIFLNWVETNQLSGLQAQKLEDRDAFNFWIWNPYDIYKLGFGLELPELIDRVMKRLTHAMYLDEEAREFTAGYGIHDLEYVQASIQSDRFTDSALEDLKCDNSWWMTYALLSSTW